MFEKFKNRNQAAVLERLEVVEFFNDLVRERIEARAKEHTLLTGLEQAEARRAAIPGEEQEVHDNCYRNTVQREVDPSRPDLTETHNQQLETLKAEHVALTGKIRAYGAELQEIERTLSKLDGQYGAIERARRAAWEAIADQLAAKVSDDFPQQFRRLWTAMDRVRDGIPVAAVLSKIVSTELDAAFKLPMIDELSREYGVANEYE